MTWEGLLMYIWVRNTMECWGASLGKRGSPWNIVEGELVSMGYISRRFQKGYKARKRGGKRLGLWWVLVASTVFQGPQTVPSRHYSILSITLAHLLCV